MIRAVDEAIKNLLQEELAVLPSGAPAVAFSLPPEDLPGRDALTGLLQNLFSRPAGAVAQVPGGPAEGMRGALAVTVDTKGEFSGTPDGGTISVYLYQLRENLGFREQGRSVERHAEGNRATVYQPPVFLDLHYAVSVQAACPEREHRLLAEAIAALIRYRELDVARWVPAGTEAAEVVAALRHQEPFPMQVAHPDALPDPVRFWQALGRKPRPAFSLVVTATIEPHRPHVTPLVTRTILGVGGASRPDSRPVHWVSIAGTVNDEQERPQSGVRVSLPGHPPATHTDSRGFYFFLNLPEGEYHVRAFGHGAMPETRSVRVVNRPAAQYVAVDFTLASAVLTGCVRRSPGSKPLPGISVRAGDVEAFTDREGGYGFRELPAGAVRLSVQAPGYLPVSQHVQISANRPASIDFLLHPASLSGAVYDRTTGSPISGAYVEVSGHARLTTGEFGEFGLEHLSEGPHRLIASAPGYRAVEQHITTRRAGGATPSTAILRIPLEREAAEKELSTGATQARRRRS